MEMENKSSPIGLLVVFFAVVLSGVLLSAVYLFINRISPLIYLCLLAAVALGGAVGFVAGKVAGKFKIKSTAALLVVVLLGCLVFSYFKWAMYVSADFNTQMTKYYGDDFYDIMYTYYDFDVSFTDENWERYTDAELAYVIEAMKTTSAYDWYGGAQWQAQFEKGNNYRLTEADLYALKNYSYYEYNGWADFFGNDTYEAVTRVNQLFDSHEYGYYYDFYRNGEVIPGMSYYVFNPGRMLDLISRINGEGRWTYSQNSFDSSSALNVTGIMLCIVWLGELVVICVAALMVAGSAGKPKTAHSVLDSDVIKVNEYVPNEFVPNEVVANENPANNPEQPPVGAGIARPQSADVGAISNRPQFPQSETPENPQGNSL